MAGQLSFLIFIGIVALSSADIKNDDKCPDDFIFKEINGIRNCHKYYKINAQSVTQCNLIDVCRPLYLEAIPATIKSIEQREYLKTLPAKYLPDYRKSFTLIGVSIPCGKSFNSSLYMNADDTPLPVPLEYTGTPTKFTNQIFGMLFNNRTDNFDPRNVEWKGDVLCSIPP